MLDVKNISVYGKKDKILLNNISLSLNTGEIIGLTGQSGSGKTTFIKSVMGVLDHTCRMSQGSITVDGLNISCLSNDKRRKICGTTIGFVPQNPMTAFDKRIKIGKQLHETFSAHLKINAEKSYKLSCQLLKEVNLTDTERIMNSYPSQLSGGMLQRIAMVIILGLNPKYILADEPTSALDEENKNILLSLILNKLNKCGILVISHDVQVLGLLSNIMVMESGEITETGTLKKLMNNPKRQWTKQFSKVNIKQDRRYWQWTEL